MNIVVLIERFLINQSWFCNNNKKIWVVVVLPPPDSRAHEVHVGTGTQHSSFSRMNIVVMPHPLPPV